jgi:hypothetical protein
VTASSIRLHVHYPDDCPPSLIPFATAEVAARVGEAMERRYPGAIADVERWCERHGRWEAHCVCCFCGFDVCEHDIADEDGEDLICRQCWDEREGACCDHFCADCTGVSETGPI